MKGQLEKEIKLQNFEAHYKTILSDIAQASNELSLIKKELSEQIDTLNSVKAKVDIEFSELQKITQEKDNVLSDIQSKKDSLVKFEESKKKEFQKKEDDISAKLRDSEAKTKLLSIENHSIINQIDVNSQKLASLIKEVETMEETIQTLKDSRKLEEEISEKSIKQFYSNIEQLKNVVKGIDDEIVLKTKQLSDIEKEYTEKVDFIKNSQDILKEREARIHRREQDSMVVRKRLAKKHKELFPDLVFKIE
jgi:chromosome segregation ATPase